MAEQSVAAQSAERQVQLGRPGIGIVLMGGITLIAITVIAVASYLDIRAREDDARKALDERGSTVARSASNALGRALQENDIEALNDLSIVVWSQPDVAYMNIFDGRGQWLIGCGEDETRLPGDFHPEVLERVQDLQPHSWKVAGTPCQPGDQSSNLELTGPVLVGANLVGAVQFGFDTARIDDEIHTLTLNRIAETVVLAGFAVAFAFILVRYFVRPITVLVHATEKLAAGDLATRVERLRGREMGELGYSFNTMASELQGKVEELQASQRDLLDSRSRIVTGEERVRRSIAANLHGPVQGRLLGLRAQIDEIARRSDMPEEASEALGAIVDDMGEVIQRDIAVLSRQLYPAIIRRGLVPALQSLGDQFEATLDLELKIDDAFARRERRDPALIPLPTKLAAYRIAHEALTNVVKHARDSHVLITLDNPADGIFEVSVRDNGPGFDQTSTSEGMGLASIQDYAEAVGGTCRIESGVRKGTAVSAQLPLDDGAGSSA